MGRNVPASDHTPTASPTAHNNVDFIGDSHLDSVMICFFLKRSSSSRVSLHCVQSSMSGKSFRGLPGAPPFLLSTLQEECSFFNPARQGSQATWLKLLVTLLTRIGDAFLGSVGVNWSPTVSWNAWLRIKCMSRAHSVQTESSCPSQSEETTL